MNRISRRTKKSIRPVFLPTEFARAVVV